MKISPTQASYIAGIIDGEGTLSMSYYKGAVDSYGKKYRSFSMTCRVTNTNKEVVDVFIMIKLLNVPPSRTGFKLKRQWSWLLPANGCREILPQLYPYLIIKKRQAEIFLDWFRDVSGRRGKNMTKELFQHKLEVLAELHTLNKRGL